MSRDAADFAVREVDLTEMDATAQSYTQWRDAIGNGVRAANSGGRGIKDRDKAVSTIPDFPATKPAATWSSSRRLRPASAVWITDGAHMTDSPASKNSVRV